MAEPLRGLVELALAKEPEDRPTARELLDMLLGDRPVPRRSPSVVGAQNLTAVVDRPDLLVPASYDYDDHPLRPAGFGPGKSTRSRNSSGVRWLAFLAVLLVIAGIVTVAAVLGVGDKVGDALVAGAQGSGGGSAVGAPATASAGLPVSGGPAPARSSAPAAQAPTRTRKPTPIEPTGGEVIIQDPLNQPGQWLDSEIREQNANCFTRGVMQAGRIDRGTYQCVGPEETIQDDFGVEVTTALQTAGSCAAIWFHWTSTAGGHVLKVCQGTMSVGADMPNDRRVFGTVRLAKPIGLKKATRVHLVVRNGRADLYRSGTFVGSVALPAGQSDTGQVRLGISVETVADPPPYTVTFANVDIRSL
jgi:hypothetical protein